MSGEALAARLRRRLAELTAELRTAWADAMRDTVMLPQPESGDPGTVRAAAGPSGLRALPPSGFRAWWDATVSALAAGDPAACAAAGRSLERHRSGWELRRDTWARGAGADPARYPFPMPPAAEDLGPEDLARIMAVTIPYAMPGLWHPRAPLPLTAGQALDLVEAEAGAMAAELARGIEGFAQVFVRPELVAAVLARPDVAARWPWPEPWPVRPGGPGSVSPGWSALSALLGTVDQRRGTERSAEMGHVGPRLAQAGDLRRNWMPNEAAPLDAALWAVDGLNRLEPGLGEAELASVRDGAMLLHRPIVTEDGAVLTAGGAALLFLAERDVEADRRRPVLAVDANKPHHAMLTGWTGLGAGRLEPRKTSRGGDVRIDLLTPGEAVQLSLPGAGLTEEVIQTLRRAVGLEGVRSWAAMLRLLSVEGGRRGWVRWTVDDHLEALGYTPGERRRQQTRDRVAATVELFTRLELSVTVDGRERERRPILLRGGTLDRLEAGAWRVEGMDLTINPLLYHGVRDAASGKLGSYWLPTVPEVAQLDHNRHGPAVVMGLVLPIRMRWALGDGRDHLALRGDNLLKLAGINYNSHDPGRAWGRLERNLAKLGEIDALGEWRADDGGRKPGAVYRLHPPGWVLDRYRRGVTPVEHRTAELPRTGAELRAWREASDRTQAEAAAALGVSARTVLRAEALGDRPLTAAIKRGLAALP